MKLDTWYDLTCNCCSRSWSADFENGMYTSKKCLQKDSHKSGWRCRRGKNLCPDCAKKPDAIIFGEG